MPPIRQQAPSGSLDRGADSVRGEDAHLPDPLLGQLQAPSGARLSQLEHRVEHLARSVNALNARAAGIENSFRELLSLIETYMNEAAAHQGSAPQPATAQQSRTRVVGVAVLAVVVGFAAVGAYFFVAANTRTPAAVPARAGSTAAQPPAAPAPSTPPQPASASAPVPAASAAAAPAPPPAGLSAPVAAVRPDAPPAGVSSPGRIALTLDSTESTWVSVVTPDGVKLLERVLQPGAPASLQLDGPARVRTGNAGGLVMNVAGKSVGSIGPRGAVRDVELDKDGTFRVAPVAPKPLTDSSTP